MGYSRTRTIPNNHLQLLSVNLISGAQGILVVYDITDKESFNAVKTWISEIKKYAQSDVVKLLIGNKCDLESKREIEYEEGKQLAETLGMDFLETSAKETTRIEDAFIKMTREVLDNMKIRGVAEEEIPTITEVVRKRKTEGGNCKC